MKTSQRLTQSLVSYSAGFFVLAQLFHGITLHAGADKSAYTLFNPTPADKMREFSTDRPDKTESPYTVDAGHFQIETDLINYTEDSTDAGGLLLKNKGMLIGASNLKMGLTNFSDLQLILLPYQKVASTLNGVDLGDTSGMGDTYIRLKLNVYGNDEGNVAIGFMPFVKLPTNTNGLGHKKTEAGLITPIAIGLPGDWDLGLMSQINYEKNSANDDYHTTFIQTYTIGHGIIGELAGYFEVYSESSGEPGTDWVATVDAGLTYKVTPNVQLDLGCNFGVTAPADDLNPFLGISARL